jgi:hypothetical protein
LEAALPLEKTRLAQLVEKRFGFPEVRLIESLGEPQSIGIAAGLIIAIL